MLVSGRVFFMAQSKKQVVEVAMNLFDLPRSCKGEGDPTCAILYHKVTDYQQSHQLESNQILRSVMCGNILTWHLRQRSLYIHIQNANLPFLSYLLHSLLRCPVEIPMDCRMLQKAARDFHFLRQTGGT